MRNDRENFFMSDDKKVDLTELIQKRHLHWRYFVAKIAREPATAATLLHLFQPP
jgi:hypothetical protein